MEAQRDRQEIEKQLINRFQDNLSAVRKVARMTSSNLAEEIGVTRQTIHALESEKVQMSKMQYLALRQVFNTKAINNPALAQVIKTLVDDPVEDFLGGIEELNEEEVTARVCNAGAVGASSIITAVLAARAVGGFAVAMSSLARAIMAFKK